MTFKGSSLLFVGKRTLRVSCRSTIYLEKFINGLLETLNFISLYLTFNPSN